MKLQEPGKMRAAHKPDSVSKQSSVWEVSCLTTQAIFQKTAGHLNLLVNLAPERSLPGKYLSVFPVVSYTTVAPEPYGCLLFCGTCPEITFGGRYPSFCPEVSGLSSYK